MQRLTSRISFVCLLCFGVVFATNARPSSTSKWSINNIFNRPNENSRSENVDFNTKQGIPDEATTTSISPTTSERATRLQSENNAGPHSRIASDDLRRQRLNNAPTSPFPGSRGGENEVMDPNDDVRRQRVNNAPTRPFSDSREGENEMMDPSMFWNPWALWAMRWANAWQRSTRSAPWNRWYRMNPMFSFWNQFMRSVANGNGYGYGQQYPDEYPERYSRVSDGEYRPDRYASYPERESQGMYRQPAASSYYRPGQPTESSSRPYYRDQRIPQPSQPNYRNQRVDDNVESPPGTGRVSQNYRQQSTAAASESNVPPPRNNAAAERTYRETSTDSKQPETSVPFTLLYYDDPPSDSNNVQSPAPSRYRNQRIESNGQRERVENR